VSHLHHKVSALIDGELSPNARTRALAHARGCVQCRREIAETLEVKRRVNRLAPVEVSGDLLDVVGSMTVAAQPVPLAPPGPRAPLLRRAFAGAGSLSAFVIALAYVVGAPQPAPASTVSPPIEEFTTEFADSTGLAPLSDPAVGGLAAESAPGGVVPISYPVGSAAPSWSQISQGADSDQSTSPPGDAETGDDPSAVQQISRAIQAPQELGFAGALVIRSLARGGIASVRIAVQHVPGQGTSYDVLRHNGYVRGTSFIQEKEAASDGFDGGPLKALAAAYDLSIEGHHEVIGRMATVVAASRHGQLAARFWIDRKTGLLLQRALYIDGRPVRWSGYAALDVDRHGFMSHLPPELTTPPSTELSMTEAPALNDKGWICPEFLAARFRLSFLHQVDAGDGVIRAEYTDGLSNLSIFEERGRLNASSLRGFQATSVSGNVVYVKTGLPMVAVWESDGTVFTVVTDAPQRLADVMIARLPHASPAADPGVTVRIGDGLSRLASAVTP
jgi:sigma-E factor negative regulatory protein RseB